mgnify:CR=1 FL=1
MIAALNRLGASSAGFIRLAKLHINTFNAANIMILIA